MSTLSPSGRHPVVDVSFDTFTGDIYRRRARRNALVSSARQPSKIVRRETPLPEADEVVMALSLRVGSSRSPGGFLHSIGNGHLIQINVDIAGRDVRIDGVRTACAQTICSAIGKPAKCLQLLLTRGRRERIRLRAGSAGRWRKYPISRRGGSPRGSLGAKKRGRLAMLGDPRVIEYPNSALKHELAAVNQYWLHYRILDNWGYKDFAKTWRKESIEEMHHADKSWLASCSLTASRTCSRSTSCASARASRRSSTATWRRR